ncbi:hypothetical protein BV898_01030 [Hypsibius exemplaris]|uniref:Uncharacterized protein n=1 Tax=Hypsibius exemplaris TaxID=2072580 RepID=A0A1W0XDF3_HYPEX|nr:hypothetical protein BV898_01030 [Hypsibius exemplaris]
MGSRVLAGDHDEREGSEHYRGKGATVVLVLKHHPLDFPSSHSRVRRASKMPVAVTAVTTLAKITSCCTQPSTGL